MTSRIFQAAPIDVGMLLRLDEGASHHVAQVLRMQSNEKLIVFNDTGYDFSGKIASIKKNKVAVSIAEKLENKTESPLRLHLCQALVRNEKMDLVIQKAVELGVTDFTPVETQHCQIRLSKEKKAKKYEHWQGIIQHATGQSGRTRLMHLHPLIDFNTWCVQNPNGILLHPESSLSLSSIKSSSNGFCVLIGPEGGLAETEIALAKNCQIESYRFGPRVFRTETAGLAIMAYLQATCGDLLG